MTGKRTYFMAVNGIVAACYVILTLICNCFGLANNVIQIRISEALTILPYFSGRLIPGLALGCLISNIMVGAMLPDVIFGTLATLIGGIGTWLLRKKFELLAPIPPIISNSIIIPFVLKHAYGLGPLRFMIISVGIGEIISCGVLGMLLLRTLKKRKIFDAINFV